MSIMAIMPYILAAQAIILGVVGFWLVWHFKLRTVFKAELYEALNKSAFGTTQYFKVATVEFKKDDKTVNHKKYGAFTVYHNKKVQTDGRVHVWAFDANTKEGLTFGGTHETADPTFTQALLYSGVVKRFTNMITAFDAQTWLIIILLVVVAVLCFISGLFASPHILPQPVSPAVNSTVSVPTV